MQCAAVATNFLETENKKNKRVQLQMRLRVIVIEINAIIAIVAIV